MLSTIGVFLIRIFACKKALNCGCFEAYANRNKTFIWKIGKLVLNLFYATVLQMQRKLNSTQAQTKKRCNQFY